MDGSRKHLLFLPGLLTDQRLWGHVLASVQQRFRVCASQVHDWQSLPNVYNAIVQNAPPRFSLVAHSISTVMACEIFWQHSHRIESLYFINPVWTPMSYQNSSWKQHLEVGSDFEQSAQGLASALSPHPGAALCVRDAMLQLGVWHHQAQKERFHELRCIADLLSTLCAPVHLITAKGDPWVAWSEQEQIAKRLSQCSHYTIYAPAGHYLPLEQPEGVSHYFLTHP